MKCKECGCCRQGFFKSSPDAYVCIGVKEPFIINDINVDCTEYEYLRVARQEEKNYDRRTALSVLQDLSTNMYPNHDIFGNKTLVIDRDKFEAVRKKYLDKN